MSSLEQSDRDAAAVQKTPHRVTLAALEAKIAMTDYFTAAEAVAASDKSGKPLPASYFILTMCVMVLQNGFVIVGKSAPADPGNFDADLGKKFAREDCIRQAWQLEGYLLRDHLAGFSKGA